MDHHQALPRPHLQDVLAHVGEGGQHHGPGRAHLLDPTRGGEAGVVEGVDDLRMHGGEQPLPVVPVQRVEKREDGVEIPRARGIRQHGQAPPLTRALPGRSVARGPLALSVFLEQLYFLSSRAMRSAASGAALRAAGFLRPVATTAWSAKANMRRKALHDWAAVCPSLAT